MNWLRKLIGLCVHRWAVLKTHDVYERGHSDQPVHIDYVLQCEHCGDIKRIRA